MKKENNKLVSIIIPVYNGEKYINEAIESALNQTYPNVEVIVINDGSTDNTEEVCMSYKNKIKYYKKENGGVASALNYGIKVMNGDYFSWLSHDDVYLPEKVEKEINAIINCGDEMAVVTCNVNVVDENLNLIRSNNIPNYAPQNMQAYLAYDQTAGLNGCALLINKKIFTKYLFDENLKVTQDYDMWFRMANTEKFIKIDDHLVLSRQHNEQGSRTMVKDVSIEVDKLHSGFMEKLSNKQTLDYIDDDSDKLVNSINIYNLCKCYNSSSMIISNIINSYKEINKENDALKFINKILIGYDSIDFNKLLLSNSFTDSIIVHVKNADDKNKIKIKNVIYIVEDKNIYDEKDSIMVMSNENLSDKIVMINILLKSKLFVELNNNEYVYPVFEGLKKVEIKNVFITNQYFDIYQNIYTISKLESKNNYLNYANLIIWSDYDSYNIYSLSNNNAVYLKDVNYNDIINNILNNNIIKTDKKSDIKSASKLYEDYIIKLIYEKSSLLNPCKVNIFTKIKNKMRSILKEEKR